MSRAAAGACDLQRDSPTDASFHRHLTAFSTATGCLQAAVPCAPRQGPSYQRSRRASDASAQRHFQGQVRVTCRAETCSNCSWLVFGCVRSFPFDCFLLLPPPSLLCLAALSQFFQFLQFLQFQCRLPSIAREHIPALAVSLSHLGERAFLHRDLPAEYQLSPAAIFRSGSNLRLISVTSSLI
jgi:hypothetical protein